MATEIEAMADSAAAANEEAIEAWDGPLYERFVRFRDVITTGLGMHGEEALRLNPPRPGERVLDIGCGFGDTAQRIAELVGPEGRVLGVDVSPRFIETAKALGLDESGEAFDRAMDALTKSKKPSRSS